MMLLVWSNRQGPRSLQAQASVVAAQSSVVAAQANVDKAALDLGFTKVTSPIDGIAGIAKAQIGNLVGRVRPRN